MGPISLMWAHTHHKNSWMISYRHMYMSMEGLREGTDALSDANVYNNYMVTPQKMSMQMHMLGVMFAPTDRLTFMLMTNYTDHDMDLRTRMGVDFSTRASGYGDMKLGALYRIMKKGKHQFHASAGISLPTADLNQRDGTPMGDDQKLPYAMQLGSGTYDLLPGFTYQAFTETLSWGGQIRGIIRTGESSEGYTLGDQYKLNLWTAYKFNHWISASLRLEGQSTGEIEGQDTELNPMMVPTANTGNYGGENINGGLGLNFLIPQGALKGLRIAAEYIQPMYQNASGIQMENKSAFTLGCQYIF